MVNNKKVIVVTPSGRRGCLQILKNYITKAKGVVDEWHLWVNTVDQDDLDYIQSLANKSPQFIKLKTVKPDHEMTRDWRQWNLHLFYKHCQEDAVYVRIDDDIVWIEDGAIKKLVEFRIANPKVFTIYPNILNNSLMSYVQCRMGNTPTKYGIPKYETFDEISLKSGDFFVDYHTQILKDIKNNNMDKYKYRKWILNDYEHHSITVSSFMDMSWRNGELGENDEVQINIDIPKEIGIPNQVYGQALFVHWQYYYQRVSLEEKGLNPDMFLKEYLEISKL